jgi:hypothetical protein
LYRQRRGFYREHFAIVGGSNQSFNQSADGNYVGTARVSSGLGGKVDQNPSTGGVCSLAKITAGRVERGATSL